MVNTKDKYVELFNTLNPILDYLEESESKHYEECSITERKIHIYRNVLRAKEIISEMKIKTINNKS